MMLSILLVCAILKGATATLDLNEVPIVKKGLFVPSLEELAVVLGEGLQGHFEEVQVDVVDCPDLRETPFGLTGRGLNGNTRLVAIGGSQYLMPYVNRSKVYNLRDVIRIMDSTVGFVIGACAGPYDYLGVNGDNTCNLYIDGETIDQGSMVMILNDDGSYKLLERLPNNETRCDVLTDVFVSEGKPGPVLRIVARKRTQEDSFAVAIRKVLARHYASNVVALGGTFLLKEGSASHTLLPDFPKTPINDMFDLMRWVKHYNMSAPLVGVGTLISGKCDLDLRLDHFHTFSHHGDGGHFNNDVTPETAEYLGYFNAVEYVYRIDKPAVEIFRPNE